MLPGYCGDMGGVVSRAGVSSAVRGLICAGCFLAFGGCTAVQKTYADGTQAISLHPFEVEAIHQPAESPQLITTAALGISRTTNSFNIGFQREEVVIAPARCHAIFVVHSEAQAFAAARLAEFVNKGCVIQR